MKEGLRRICDGIESIVWIGVGIWGMVVVYNDDPHVFEKVINDYQTANVDLIYGFIPLIMILVVLWSAEDIYNGLKWLFNQTSKRLKLAQ